MFPVLSLLRRCAYNVVYVRPDALLRGEDGRLRLAPGRSVTVFDLSTGTWLPAREVFFFTLSARGKTAEEVAVMLTRAENKLAARGKLMDCVYTLLLGEERETRVPGEVARVLPVAIVRGVQRLAGAAAVTPGPRPPREKVFSRKLPRGVIVERR